MGNSQVQQNDALKELNFLQEMHHQQLGRIKIYETKQNNEFKIFEWKRFAKSEKDLQLWIEHFEKRKQYTEPILTKILYVTQKEANFCSEANEITIMGEYFPQNLQQEEENNLINKLQFNESRLWFLIYHIIKACAYLQQNKEYHGNLRPSTIYLDQNGSAKLIEHNFIPDGDIGLYMSDYKYIPPEIHQESMEFIDFVKADVFSLGLILLQLTSQASTQILYNGNQFDYNQLRIRLMTLNQKGYSTVLQNLITQMCNIQIERPTFIEMFEGLQTLEGDILSHKAFFKSHIKV